MALGNALKNLKRFLGLCSLLLVGPSELSLFQQFIPFCSQLGVPAIPGTKRGDFGPGVHQSRAAAQFLAEPSSKPDPTNKSGFIAPKQLGI